MTSFTAKVNAQLTRQVNMNGSATCVPALTISNKTDLNFGVIKAGSGGTVVLTPAGGRSTSGGVTLFYFNTGTVSAASFAVTGNPSSSYAITLPTTYTISDGNGHNMTLNTFKSSPSATGALSSGGTDTINVGATLNVGLNQASGIYTNTTGFSVTIIYN